MLCLLSGGRCFIAPTKTFPGREARQAFLASSLQSNGQENLLGPGGEIYFLTIKGTVMTAWCKILGGGGEGGGALVSCLDPNISLFCPSCSAPWFWNCFLHLVQRKGALLLRERNSSTAPGAGMGVSVCTVSKIKQAVKVFVFGGFPPPG